MSNYPVTGIDVSKWQKQIDWSMALDQGISFAFIRASEGDKLVDAQLERNMRQTAALGIPHGIYHYFRPNLDWRGQANLFASLIQNWQFELEAVADVETSGSLPKTQLESQVSRFVQQVEAETGRTLLIYTSPGFFNRYMPATDWAWQRKLWVAHWTTARGPTIPSEWSNHGRTWTFWQYSARNQLGGGYGVATKSIDLDRFNGSPQEFMGMYNLADLPVAEQPPHDPGPQPTPEAVSYRVVAPCLHAFCSPGLNNTIVGELLHGEVVQLVDIAGTDEVWVQIDPERWVLYAYNGRKFLERVQAGQTT